MAEADRSISQIPTIRIVPLRKQRFHNALQCDQIAVRIGGRNLVGRYPAAWGLSVALGDGAQ